MKRRNYLVLLLESVCTASSLICHSQKKLNSKIRNVLRIKENRWMIMISFKEEGELETEH